MAEILQFLLGLLGNLIASEIDSRLPNLSINIIARTAKKLSDPLSERMLEEWSALLADTPGGMGKLCVAVSLSLNWRSVQHNYSYPDIPYKPFSRIWIRGMDICLAGASLLTIAPLILVIAGIMRLSGCTSIFDIEHCENVGRRRSRIVRFNTHPDSRDHRSGYLLKDLLRKYSLDGLPMLWNVLKGDLSLIGWRLPHAIATGSNLNPEDGLTVLLVSKSPVPESQIKPGVVGLKPDDLTILMRSPLKTYLSTLIWAARLGLGLRRY